MPKLPVSLEMYRVIFGRLPVAIIVADDNDKVVFFNAFAERLLGIDEAVLLGREMRSFYSLGEWDRVNALKGREIGQHDPIETKMLKPDGSFVDVELSVTVVKDNQGATVESILIIHDISERKTIENEALAAGHTKGEFLAMVSHELRTPLTAIKGSLGLMLEGATGEFNEEQKDFLVTAQRNADRLEILINNVLDYQRLEAGMYEFKFSFADVNGLLETVRMDMELLAEKKNLKLSLIKSEGLPAVMVDAERLKRAVRNLVDNAIKFTEKGEVSISSSFEMGQVAIHVKDTGIGIKPEDKEKLLERFSQLSSGHGRQTGSLGLGLVIARKIVSAHRGDIWIESKPGVGSTFSIFLPVSKG